MGLFDGKPSSADLSGRLGIPVLGAINAAAMAQTFAAVAHGLASLRPALPFAGVLANQVGSPRHAGMLTELMPEGLELLGHLPHARDAALPSRHLGLVAAGEIADIESRLEAASEALEGAIRELPAPVAFAPAEQPDPPRLLEGRSIAVALDAAFAFVYPANLGLLEAMGAELRYFSPVAGEPLP